MPAFKKVKKSEGGAPCKLNQEVIDTIVRAMMIGSYVETAAAHAGIHKETFYQWLKQGAKDKKAGVESLHAKLSDAVSKAFADAELRDVNNIDKHSVTDWKASAWRLERRFPKRWGKQITVNETPDADDPEKPAETFNELVTKIANEKE